MRIQEPIKFAQVRARIEVALPRHDPAWIFPQLSTDPRIVSQEVVELIMSGNPPPVIGQGRVIPKVLRNPRMSLEKLVQISQLAARKVVLGPCAAGGNAQP